MNTNKDTGVYGGSKVKVWNVTPPNGGMIKVATAEHPPRNKVDCEGCKAPCCMTLLPILSEKEFLSRKFQFQYTEIPEWLHEIIPDAQRLATVKENPVSVNKSCAYLLHKTKKCLVWPDCPEACKAYDCRTDERFDYKYMNESKNGSLEK